MSKSLRAPFPWFGGKSRAAPLIWEAFGDVSNYVEPFAGSLAVLLARPTAPGVETVNDVNPYLSNFWRATAWAPEEVAAHADWPVNEVDLHARHRWLTAQVEFRERMAADPLFFDARVAGWWVWGISQWIGSGWCTRPEWQGRAHPGNGLRGIHARHASEWRQKPHLTVSRGAGGRGVNATGKDAEGVRAWIAALGERLRKVRVCCGDWSRVLTPSVLNNNPTAVLLDPPYQGEEDVYGQASGHLSAAVRKWALEHGDDPALRIALCGYEGEHDMPPSWRCVAWEAAGGYAAARGNTENKKRERVWFSPHCLRAVQAGLFEAAP